MKSNSECKDEFYSKIRQLSGFIKQLNYFLQGMKIAIETSQYEFVSFVTRHWQVINSAIQQLEPIAKTNFTLGRAISDLSGVVSNISLRPCEIHKKEANYVTYECTHKKCKQCADEEIMKQINLENVGNTQYKVSKSSHIPYCLTCFKDSGIIYPISYNNCLQALTNTPHSMIYIKYIESIQTIRQISCILCGSSTGIEYLHDECDPCCPNCFTKYAQFKKDNELAITLSIDPFLPIYCPNDKCRERILPEKIGYLKYLAHNQNISKLYNEMKLALYGKSNSDSKDKFAKAQSGMSDVDMQENFATTYLKNI